MFNIIKIIIRKSQIEIVGTNNSIKIFYNRSKIIFNLIINIKRAIERIYRSFPFL